MAYKVNPRGLVRDRTYPSEIAAQRPLCATRIHCQESFSDEMEAERSTIRGDRGYQEYPPMAVAPGLRDGDITEDRVKLFNQQLRGGHAGRNDGDE